MSDFPQRKSPRLKGYDYTLEGAYFVTICVQNQLCLFGKVEQNEIVLNAAGYMVSNWWEELPAKYDDIQLDSHVVMPNHFHGIVYINRHNVKDTCTSLIDAVRWFKAMTTNAYIQGVKLQGWRRFPGKLWQRKFHDHIIRNQKDLTRIQEYVLNNPSRWVVDTFYSDE